MRHVRACGAIYATKGGMIKKALILPLFLACSSLAFAGGWVDRAAGIAANTYVDFPVRAGNAISVLVSNALSSAEGEPSVRPFTLAMPKGAPGAGGPSNPFMPKHPSRQSKNSAKAPPAAPAK